jgi:two-component system chemotaxis response regulator CheY
VERRAFISQRLEKLRDERDHFVESISAYVEQLPHAKVYPFADNDVIILCCPKGEAEQTLVRNILEKIAGDMPKELCDYGFLTKELPLFQKIAEQKMLSAKRMEAYEALGEKNQLKSIPLRRKRRDAPLIMVVEDDRFTASYMQNFLREYDVVIARNGEEAILKYIEYAPDAVFMDLHMPGLNGDQALQGIKAADPDAFVVMLSVDTAQASIMSASEHGATSYLKKPFSRERVLNTLRLSPFIRDSQGVLPYILRPPRNPPTSA